MAVHQNVLLAVCALLTIAQGAFYVQASDPELTKDFFVPEGTNVSTIESSFFTFTGFRQGDTPASVTKFAVNKAFSGAFPALTGLGVASAQLSFLAGGINPPHTHPRASEILFICAGSLDVGFVDTTNKLYTQTLQTGDMFVFPKGLVHYQVNNDPNVEAKAIASFSSSDPGLILLPTTLFGSGINETVLAQSFGLNETNIGALEDPFKPVLFTRN